MKIVKLIEKLKIKNSNMDTSDQSITIVRTFDAPREKVWKAWTTPDAWESWYGQPGETKPGTAEMDVVVGGRWKSTTSYDGQEIPFTGTYKEVVQPERLVLTFDDPTNPDNAQVETVVVDFKSLADKSEMTFTQSGNLPPEEYQKGLKEGWSGFFDALERYLAQTP